MIPEILGSAVYVALVVGGFARYFRSAAKAADTLNAAVRQWDEVLRGLSGEIGLRFTNGPTFDPMITRKIVVYPGSLAGRYRGYQVCIEGVWSEEGDGVSLRSGVRVEHPKLPAWRAEWAGGRGPIPLRKQVGDKRWNALPPDARDLLGPLLEGCKSVALRDRVMSSVLEAPLVASGGGQTLHLVMIPANLVAALDRMTAFADALTAEDRQPFR